MNVRIIFERLCSEVRLREKTSDYRFGDSRDCLVVVVGERKICFGAEILYGRADSLRAYGTFEPDDIEAMINFLCNPTSIPPAVAYDLMVVERFLRDRGVLARVSYLAPDQPKVETNNGKMLVFGQYGPGTISCWQGNVLLWQVFTAKDAAYWIV